MNNLIASLYLRSSTFFTNIGDFVSGEVGRIKKDETGMELIQVILIILMVIIIAVALWTFLGSWITDLLQNVLDESSNINSDGISQPTP